MKKRKLNGLHLKKQIVSALNQDSILGGLAANDKFTVTCARPVSECTVALTVQPDVCYTLPRPLSGCTVQYSIQVWCQTQGKDC